MSWYTPTIYGLPAVQHRLGSVCYRRKRLGRLKNKDRAEVIVIAVHDDTGYVDYLDAAELKAQYEQEPHSLHVGIYSKGLEGFLKQYEPIRVPMKKWDMDTQELR